MVSRRRRSVRISVAVLLALMITPIIAFTIYHLATPGRGSAAMKLALLYLESRDEPTEGPRLAAYLKHLRTRQYPSPTPPPSQLRSKYEIAALRVADQPVFQLVPRANRSGTAIIYLHGGGFVHPLQPMHWRIAESLAEAAGATVFLPAYPLAPEHDHRAAWPFLRAVYDQVIKETSPKRLFLAGDSAGGGLALAQTLMLRGSGAPLPAGIILFSPWVDLALRDPRMQRFDAVDPMLSLEPLRVTGQWWARPDRATASHVSPLFADLSGLPPVYIFQGDRDLFVITSRQLAAKLRKAKVPVQYVEYPGAFHVHVTARFTPETKDTFRKVEQAVRHNPA